MPEHERKSVLADRIASGQADPISDEEREIVAKLRAAHDSKYGQADKSQLQPVSQMPNLASVCMFTVGMIALAASLVGF